MTEALSTKRIPAHTLPAVKTFTDDILIALKPLHFRRAKRQSGMNYEYASYLLHTHAGYLPPAPSDAGALEDLARILATRRPPLAA